MLKMTGLEEVVGRRQLLACPDVPAARAAGGRVPEAVDGKHTRAAISCYADHLAGQNWRSRDPESPGHIAATAETDLHHVRRLRAAARPPSVVSTDSVVSIMLPASPPSHARQVRPGSTCTVDRTDSCGGPHRAAGPGSSPADAARAHHDCGVA